MSHAERWGQRIQAEKIYGEYECLKKNLRWRGRREEEEKEEEGGGLLVFWTREEKVRQEGEVRVRERDRDVFYKTV